MKNDHVDLSLFHLLHHQYGVVRDRAASVLAARVLGNPAWIPDQFAAQGQELSVAATKDVVAWSRGEPPLRLQKLALDQSEWTRDRAKMAIQRLEAMRRQVGDTQPATRPAP